MITDAIARETVLRHESRSTNSSFKFVGNNARIISAKRKDTFGIIQSVSTGSSSSVIDKDFATFSQSDGFRSGSIRTVE